MRKRTNLELALYLAFPEETRRLDRATIHRLLSTDSTPPDLHPFLKPHCERVYFGAEFCHQRLPGASVIRNVAAGLQSLDLPFTFVTPPTPESGLNRVMTALATVNEIASSRPGIEAAINDWGVFQLARKSFGSVALVMGRCLTKLYNDVRFDSCRTEIKPNLVWLRCNSHDSSYFRRFVSGMGVQRVEVDLPEQGIRADFGKWNLRASLHLPFTRVATGRRCFIGCSTRAYHLRPALDKPCAQPCRDISFVLAAENAEISPPSAWTQPATLLGEGNSLFYRSSAVSKLKLAGLARRGFDRVVLYRRPS